MASEEDRDVLEFQKTSSANTRGSVTKKHQVNTIHHNTMYDKQCENRHQKVNEDVYRFTALKIKVKIQ